MIIRRRGREGGREGGLAWKRAKGSVVFTCEARPFLAMRIRLALLATSLQKQSLNRALLLKNQPNLGFLSPFPRRVRGGGRVEGRVRGGGMYRGGKVATSTTNDKGKKTLDD